ncbi:MAG: hypothetical protein ABIH03_16175, partial [Pseudomonadota bacterium]
MPDPLDELLALEEPELRDEPDPLDELLAMEAEPQAPSVATPPAAPPRQSPDELYDRARVSALKRHAADLGTKAIETPTGVGVGLAESWRQTKQEQEQFHADPYGTMEQRRTPRPRQAGSGLEGLQPKINEEYGRLLRESGVAPNDADFAVRAKEAEPLAEQFHVEVPAAMAYKEMKPFTSVDEVKEHWYKALPAIGLVVPPVGKAIAWGIPVFEATRQWKIDRQLKGAVARLKEMQAKDPDRDLRQTPEYDLVDGWLNMQAEIAIRGRRWDADFTAGVLDLAPYMAQFAASNEWAKIARVGTRKFLWRNLAKAGVPIKAAKTVGAFAGHWTAAGARMLYNHPRL